ncbi:MBL fold metallo-hydrolase [Hoyosella sp. G463]|uniref:MBL fold metallo-hydrolase n=1 Tax=Lolliginicoccus lacisalsi TaxID=2742202 RepID=A0A927JBE7_9ACTN|nr:MBL fold metallo-hydrolase [Lolliginicoccus lacisalsi]
MRRIALGGALTASAAAGAVASARIARATGASRARIRPYTAGSEHFRDGRFHNLEPVSAFSREQVVDLVKAMARRGSEGSPSRPIPVLVPLAPAVAADLGVTWLGHASTLVEVDRHRFLTDPVWSDRVSPSQAMGPRRFHPVPVRVGQLPKLDAVLISHDHYDHLDEWSVRAIAAAQPVRFIVPLGVGAHLRSWGVASHRITELDWNESTTVGESSPVEVTCTPARHFSGRGLSRNTTLWSSFVLAGPRHRVFFGGDSGYMAEFARIGAEHGPFDLTVLPVGAYAEQWPDVHMNPEEAVRAHGDLTAPRGGVLLPVHWGTFNLAFHSWVDPMVRLQAASEAAGARVVVPRPGQRVDMVKPLPTDRWWLRCG